MHFEIEKKRLEFVRCISAAISDVSLLDFSGSCRITVTGSNLDVSRTTKLLMSNVVYNFALNVYFFIYFAAYYVVLPLCTARYWCCNSCVFRPLCCLCITFRYRAQTDKYIVEIISSPDSPVIPVKVRANAFVILPNASWTVVRIKKNSF